LCFVFVALCVQKRAVTIVFCFCGACVQKRAAGTNEGWGQEDSRMVGERLNALLTVGLAYLHRLSKLRVYWAFQAAMLAGCR